MAKKDKFLKPEGTRIYSYWSALYMSFYSKRLYVDIGKRWKGVGLCYFFLVCCFVFIPVSIKVGLNVKKDIDQQIIDPISKLPTVYIQNGVLLFDKPMPYLIKNDKNQVVTIIDSTGQVNDFNNKNYPFLTILLNKDKIGMRMPNPQILGNQNSLPDFSKPNFQIFNRNDNYVFNADTFTKGPMVNGMKLFTEISVYPIILSLFFSFFSIILLVLAFMGQIFASVFFTFPITFKQSCRFMMTASTPTMFLFSVLLVTNLILPGLGGLLLLSLVGYFAFALLALKSESRWIVRTN